MENYLSMLVLVCCTVFCVAQVFSQQQTMTVDVLVVGGGTGGWAAGVQAARLGVKTLIVEETPWLGGMLTAAGVSATDGNHELAGGLWGEFREKIRQYYGGADKVLTGWVSNTLFEPSVGDSIIKSIAQQEKNLVIMYGYKPIKILKNSSTITGVIFFSTSSQEQLEVRANITIETTETGELLNLGKIPFDIGFDSQKTSGENIAPKRALPVIQDITYCAILKDYGMNNPYLLTKPSGYDSLLFYGSCKEFSPDTSETINAQKMLDYAKLPVKNGGAKYLLNWPKKGNDFYAPHQLLFYDKRSALFEQAKQRTLQFVYFLQHQLGFTNLGLADNEFMTKDKLPFIPYYRESRRVQGIIRFTLPHIQEPYRYRLFRTAISVGDYPIDHHHARYDGSEPLPKIVFPSIASYSVPLAALIPKSIDGLICAEKNISVSNIVNGTTRLQPNVLLTGQAAGALAALAVQNKVQPRAVSIRSVQSQLLRASCYLMPFVDAHHTDPSFEKIQKIGLTGAMVGVGVPDKWANKTYFYPTRLATVRDLYFGVSILLNDKYDTTYNKSASAGQLLTTGAAYSFIRPLFPLQSSNPTLEQLRQGNKVMTRKDLAIVLHDVFLPFEKSDVNHLGQVITLPQKSKK